MTCVAAGCCDEASGPANSNRRGGVGGSATVKRGEPESADDGRHEELHGPKAILVIHERTWVGEFCLNEAKTHEERAELDRLARPSSLFGSLQPTHADRCS